MDKSSQEIATVNTEAEYGNSKKRIHATTKTLTYIATLVAASLVLKIASGFVKTQSFTLSLAYVPWIISAIVMGPLGGAVVASITDVLGALIDGFVPNPILTLGYAVFCVIVGLIFRIPKLDARLKMLIAMAIVIPVCTLGIHSLGMTVYYAAQKNLKSFFGYMALRGPQVLVVVFNAVVTVFFFPILRKMKLMD